MLRIKGFDEKKVIFIDEKDQEYVLIAEGDHKFDRDIIEDILDWEYRSRHKVGKK